MGNENCCAPRDEDSVFDRGHVQDFYDLEDKVLGSGAQGYVVLGTARQDHQRVAVKVIRIVPEDDKSQSDASMTEQEMRQLQREIAITKECVHRNVIKTFAAFLDPRQVEIVMEAATGGEVAHDFAERGGYSEFDTRHVIKQLAEALEYIHGRSIVHRDVKPENVLYLDGSKELIKLVDFGFAFASKKSNDCHAMVGTLPFMAPELFPADIKSRNREDFFLEGYGPQVDVWAMGVFSFLLLTGQLPFDGQKFHEFHKAIMDGFQGFADSSETKELSDDSKTFVHLCLQQKEEDRIDSAKAVAHPWMTADLEEKHKDTSPVMRTIRKVRTQRLKTTLKSRSNMKLRGAVFEVIAEHRLQRLSTLERERRNNHPDESTPIHHETSEKTVTHKTSEKTVHFSANLDEEVD